MHSHRILTAFLRKLGPFLMGNGPQLFNILQFVCCNRPLQVPEIQATVTATIESSRIALVDCNVLGFPDS